MTADVQRPPGLLDGAYLVAGAAARVGERSSLRYELKAEVSRAACEGAAAAVEWDRGDLRWRPPDGPVPELSWELEVGPAAVRVRRCRPQAAVRLSAVVPDQRKLLSVVSQVRIEESAVSGPVRVVPGGPRGVVRGFSDASRRRLVSAWAFREWPDRMVALTLTYPGDWRAVAPDGRAVKRHLDSFRARWRRAFGAPRGAWKLEFQARGAPHFHLLLEVPEGVTLSGLRSWVSHSWAEVVGSPDPRHLLAGTQVTEFRAEGRAAASRYFAKHGSFGSKSYQHRVPPDFPDVGRFWGFWRLPKVSAVVRVSSAVVLEVRRLARGWYAANENWAAARSVRRVDRRTGVVRRRRVRRRTRVRSLAFGQLLGWWLLVPDGPVWLLEAARLWQAPAVRRLP